MSKDRIELIIRNIESLIRCLKEEIKDELDDELVKYEEICNYLTYYEELPYKI